MRSDLKGRAGLLGCALALFLTVGPVSGGPTEGLLLISQVPGAIQLKQLQCVRRS